MRPALRLVLASGLLLTLANPVNASTDGSLLETFEEETVLQDPTSSYYTFSSATMNDFVFNDQAHAGTKSLRLEDGGAGSASGFEWSSATSVNFCEETNYLSLWWRLDTYTTAGNVDSLDFTTAGPGGLAVNIVQVTDAGSIKLDSGNYVTGKTYPLGIWVDLHLVLTQETSGTNSCTGVSQSHKVCLTSVTLIYDGCSTARSFSVSSSFGNLDGFRIDPVGTGRILWLDDIHPSGNIGIPGSRFCANPADPPNFEYTYVAGWDFFEDFGFDTDDGFLAETDTSETAYMGKGFDTGSKSFRTIARIEAGQDADDSLFAIAYTKGTGGLPSASTDGTGLEETGLDGGNFDDSLQVIFLEDGNDWNIGIYENVAGTVARIGAAVAHGNPNSPTTYAFEIDTRTQLVRVLDENLDPIFERSMAAGTADDVFKDQWFAASANSVLFDDGLTVVDDPDQDEGTTAEDSTCIYDLEGSSVINGGSGLQPPSEIVDNTTDTDDSECSSALVCTNEANIPEGFTIGTFNALLGMFLIAGISGGAYFTLGRSAVVAGAFALIGLIIAVILGLIQLWVVLVLLVIGVAVVFIGVKKGAGG